MAPDARACEHPPIMSSERVPEARSKGRNADFPMLIGGELLHSEEQYDVIDPSTGQAFAKAPHASPEQVDLAVTSAKRAFSKWQATPMVDRQALLSRVHDEIHEHAEQLAELL